MRNAKQLAGRNKRENFTNPFIALALKFSFVSVEREKPLTEREAKLLEEALSWVQ
jgi:hypothetical protein